MSKTSKLDDRGELDLERIIEEQANHIIILEKIIDQYKSELKMLKKQKEFLQDKIRDYRWKK